MLAIYTPRMRNNNLEIRIAGDKYEVVGYTREMFISCGR